MCFCFWLSCWVAKEIETKLVTFLVVKVASQDACLKSIFAAGWSLFWYLTECYLMSDQVWLVVLNWSEEIPSVFGESAVMIIYVLCAFAIRLLACVSYVNSVFKLIMICYVMLDECKWYVMWYVFVGWHFRFHGFGYADELTTTLNVFLSLCLLTSKGAVGMTMFDTRLANDQVGGGYEPSS